jgi:uncharacterized protein YggE
MVMEMGKLVALVVAALVLVGVGAAWGVEAPVAPTDVIHATGHAVVNVSADTAQVECAVKTEGKEPAQVVREAANLLQQLRETFTGLNLAGLTVRDTGVEVSVRQKAGLAAMMGGDDAPGPGGAAGNAPGSKAPTYTAVGAVTVTLYGDEAVLHKNVAQVVVSAVANGQNLTAISTTYSKLDDSRERQQAWEAAVHNAVANAQALAKGLGVTVSGYGQVSMTPPMGAENPGESIAKSSADMQAAMMERLYGGDTAAPSTKPLVVDVTVYLDAMYK